MVKPVFTLLRNTFYLVLAEAVKPVVSFFLIIYISRKLGAAEIGTYGTVITFFFFFETIATLGLGNIITRDLAVDPAATPAYYTAALVIGFITAMAATVVLLGVLGLLQYPPPIAADIRVLSGSLIFFIIAVHVQSIFEGLQRMEYKSLLGISETLGRALLGIAAVRFGYGVQGVVWGIVIVRVVVCLIALGILGRLGYRASRRIDWLLCRRLSRQALTFLMISLLSTTYWHADVVMISKMRGIAEVGFYTVAYRLMDILKGLSCSFIVALYPMLAASFRQSKDDFRHQCRQAVKYLFLLTFPIAVGTTVLADRIITLAYGSGYADAATCLQVLIWTICFFPTALVFARALVASHHQRLDLAANLLAVIFNILLNALLITRFGYSGAAAATLASILFFLALQYRFVAARLFRPDLVRRLWKPAVAGSLMGLVVHAMQHLNLALVVSAGAGVYLIVLRALRVFDDSELMVLRELLESRLLARINRRKPV